MDQLPDNIFNFCIRLLDHLDDPELNNAKIFLHSPSAAATPVRIRIQTNHLDFYTEEDFQFQFSLKEDEIRVWCFCFDTRSFSSNYFSYYYHIETGEEIEGDIASAEDWIEENFKSGYFRGMLFINSSIPEWK